MTSSIVTRTTRQGEVLTFGLAAELGIDAEAKWVTVCETHHTIIESSSRQLAYKTTGIDFCDECRAATREGQISKARAVDTELAAMWDIFHNINGELNRQEKALGEAMETRKGNDRWAPVDSINWKRNEERIPGIQAAIAKLMPQAEAARASAVAYDEANYEGWQRFFLVKHIHSSMHCSSFRWTTRVGWLPDVSGLTEAEAVTAHGETLCTICFPSAPTELTTKQADPSICTGHRNYDAPSRTGYYTGNWATCTCGQVVTLTTAGNLRKHKVA